MDEQYEITAFNQQPMSIVFTDNTANIVVFTIKPGGILEAGPGLSDDEATRKLFAVMVQVFPELMRSLATG